MGVVWFALGLSDPLADGAGTRHRVLRYHAHEWKVSSGSGMSTTHQLHHPRVRAPVDNAASCGFDRRNEDLEGQRFKAGITSQPGRTADQNQGRARAG
jgi:hypothetical protein